MKTHKLLVMLGTSPTTQGGVASVVNVYRDAGLFERYASRYLATHCDGGALRKLRTMLGALLVFAWLLLTGKVALAHIHVASRASFWRKLVFLVLARLFGVPCILHLHGAEFSLFYEKESRAVKQALIRWGFNTCARVIVLSSAWKTWVESIGVRSPVVTIHNPVTVPAPTGWHARRAGNVLFLGRLGQRKGSFDLVEAAAGLQDGAVQLLMGGDGDVEGVQRKATELGVASRVRLLGWVGAARRSELLSEAGLYCLPSYNEGLPMSLLEAMASGLPVITTPVGGIPDAVTDGVEGFLVQPGDVAAIRAGIARLVAEPALAQRMGEAARHRVEQNFSAAVILPKVETLYQQLGLETK